MNKRFHCSDIWKKNYISGLIKYINDNCVFNFKFYTLLSKSVFLKLTIKHAVYKVLHRKQEKQSIKEIITR